MAGSGGGSAAKASTGVANLSRISIRDSSSFRGRNNTHNQSSVTFQPVSNSHRANVTFQPVSNLHRTGRSSFRNLNYTDSLEKAGVSKASKSATTREKATAQTHDGRIEKPSVNLPSPTPMINRPLGRAGSQLRRSHDDVEQETRISYSARNTNESIPAGQKQQTNNRNVQQTSTESNRNEIVTGKPSRQSSATKYAPSDKENNIRSIGSRSSLTASRKERAEHRKPTGNEQQISQSNNNVRTYYALRRSREEIGSFSNRIKSPATNDSTPTTTSSTSTKSSAFSDNRKNSDRVAATTYRISKVSQGEFVNRTKNPSSLHSSTKLKNSDENPKKADQKPLTPVGQSKTTVVEGFRGCVQTGETFGCNMKEFLLASAEMYQQECLTHHAHRGDDDLFLNKDDDVPLSASGSARRLSPGEEKFKRNKSISLNAIEALNSEDSSVVPPPELIRWATTSQPPTWTVPDDNSILHREEATKPNNRQASYSGTTNTKTDNEQVDEFLKLRAVRLSMWGKSQEKTGSIDFQPVRAASTHGLQMTQSSHNDHQHRQVHTQDGFISGARDEISPNLPAANVEVRNRNDIDSQAKSVQALQQELENTKKALKEAMEALESTRRDASARQQAASSSFESLFQDRIRVEEELRQEMKKKEQLSVQVIELQKEAEALKSSLLQGKDIESSLTRTATTCSNIDSFELDGVRNLHGPLTASGESTALNDISANVTKSRSQILLKKEQRLTKLMERLRRFKIDYPSSEGKSSTPSDELSALVNTLGNEATVLPLSFHHDQDASRSTYNHRSHTNPASDNADPYTAPNSTNGGKVDSSLLEIAPIKASKSSRQALRQKEQRLTTLLQTLRCKNDETLKAGRMPSSYSVAGTEIASNPHSFSEIQFLSTDEEEVRMKQQDRTESKIVTLKAKTAALREQFDKENAARLAAKQHATRLEENIAAMHKERVDFKTVKSSASTFVGRESFQDETEMLKMKHARSEPVRIRSRIGGERFQGDPIFFEDMQSDEGQMKLYAKQNDWIEIELSS